VWWDKINLKYDNIIVTPDGGATGPPPLPKLKAGLLPLASYPLPDSDQRSRNVSLIVTQVF
jgi:hypothetical protein